MEMSAGDEVITTNQDDGRMSAPPPSMDHLLKVFEEAITPKTRVLHPYYVTNRTGQIFPVKKICQMARARNIDEVVDGAHAFARCPFKHADLDCDYYRAPLHK